MFYTEKNAQHDGRMLQTFVEKNPLRPIRIAERMGVGQSTLRSYFLRPSLHSHTLRKASIVLQHNFFFDLGMQLPPDLESALNTELHKQIQQLLAENERLKIENALYEKILKK